MKKIKNVKIDRGTVSDENFALLDEVNSDLEDDIGSLLNHLDTEFVLEECLENELDTDDEPLNSLVPKANYHGVENPTTGKTLKAGSSKAEQKAKEKGKKGKKR